MGVRQFLSGGAEAWDWSTTCGPSYESVIPLLLSLSPRVWAGNNHRALQSLSLWLSNIHASPSVASPTLNCQMRQTAKRIIDWLGPWWEATRWEESGKEKRNQRGAGGQLETSVQSRIAEECSQTEERMCLEEGQIGMDGDRGVEAQWKRSAVLLVLEILLRLTSADLDRHEGSGGVHGATQPTRSTTEGTSLCRQGKKSVSQAGTGSFSLVLPQALPHRGRHALIYKNQIKQASTGSGTTHSGRWIITKEWWGKKETKWGENKENDKNPTKQS